ncbi:MAG: PHP domain-containing protein [Saccharofermentanales bacterium]
MLDCHIHLERGEYTLDWINEFIKVALDRGLDEIWLLEHCYRFREFLPMYDSVRAASKYFDGWFYRKAGVLDLRDYLRLIDKARQQTYPVKIKFGLEVCYFKAFEEFVYQETKDKALDFLVGSVHFIDDFAYDHKPEYWAGVDVDKAYRRFFETGLDLAKSGIYDGIAHPDLIRIYGNKPSYSLIEYYNKLAATLAKNNMYAEQNSGAFRRCSDTTELGMNIDMIRAMKMHNIKIQTASDAHRPEDVGMYIKELEEILVKAL